MSVTQGEPPAVATPAPCAVCGNRHFIAGPNGRSSERGLPPRCSRCGSLERHRRLRALYAEIPASWLASASTLQLSPDIGVDPAWFHSWEVSEYSGENSLDLHAIDRADNSYDLLICNHVLEHLADDRQGYRELLRVVADSGLLQITVPSPYLRATTRDWGYPRPESHGHYRGYGRDIVQLFLDAVPQAAVLEIEVHDPVTAEGDYIYLCSRNRGLLKRLADCRFHSQLYDPAALRS